LLKRQGRIGFSPKGNVKLSNHELPDGAEKSIRNATKIYHSIFLGVKAVLLPIRFRGYSSKRCKKATAKRKYSLKALASHKRSLWLPINNRAVAGATDFCFENDAADVRS
jgi:hypothetical protein